MKIFIFGGFGFLGGRLSEYLSQNFSDEIFLGSRQKRASPEWAPKAHVVQTRWESDESLEKNLQGIDVVVHAAGMNAQECSADPVVGLEFNGSATAHLLRAAIHSGVKRFIYISTAHVYGSPLKGEVSEENCPISLHPYATSHRAGEDVVRHFNESGKIEGVVLRLSNSFGAPIHKQVNCWMLLPCDLCLQAINTGNMILRSSGKQCRNFMPLSEAVKAIAHFIYLPKNLLDNALFNVGSLWSPTVMEMAQRIANRIAIIRGIEPEVTFKIDNDVSYPLNFNVSKLRKSGFEFGDLNDVDNEIDRLIRFCTDHF